MKTLKKTQNTKEEIKKELDESIVTGGKHNNIEIDEKTRMFEKLEDAATVIREFEQIVRRKKNQRLADISTHQ